MAADRVEARVANFHARMLSKTYSHDEEDGSDGDDANDWVVPIINNIPEYGDKESLLQLFFLEGGDPPTP